MAESAVPRNPPKPQGLDWRPVVSDYRAAAGFDETDLAAADPQSAPDKNEGAAASSASSGTLSDQLDRNRLDEIAALVRVLTYGEMIEMANAIWQAQPEGAAITGDNLPALLHRWSKSRSDIGRGT